MSAETSFACAMAWWVILFIGMCWANEKLVHRRIERLGEERALAWPGTLPVLSLPAVLLTVVVCSILKWLER